MASFLNFSPDRVEHYALGVDAAYAELLQELAPALPVERHELVVGSLPVERRARGGVDVREREVDVPHVYVIGNHDTYPGEDDLALWREYFPDQPPYCAFDACGLRFVKWNGACDGIIDAVQEKWIMDECAKCPKEKQLVVLVHQPSVGKCGMERDIGRVARNALSGRSGISWLLGGHLHYNSSSSWTLPGGGTLAVAVHAWDQKGWWVYGVRNGRIVARLFKEEGTSAFSRGQMPSNFPAKGAIPVAYEDRADVVWKASVGTPEEKACRIKLENTPDNGGWLFYVGNTLYRFPKGEVAPAATRYAILGDLCGKGKAKVPAKCEMSADGESWVEVQRTAVAHEVNEFPIPSVLVGSRELWVRYTGFGMDANECHAGYAFLR